MRRVAACALLALSTASSLLADVSILERRATRRILPGKDKPKLLHSQQKNKGDITLIDASGLHYFLNTDITTVTESSASAAMQDASYTAQVNATTSAGGVVAMTLTDAFDGYNGLCVSLNGTLAQCAANNPSFTVYNQTGAAPTPECNGRQYVFPSQAIGGLSVSRKVFVPANDQFARWLNIFTNTTGAAITFSMVTSNNLGSDTDTRIVSSSNGNATAELTDTWISTFQQYGNSTCSSQPANGSCDPRLGHVLQGAGAPVPLAAISFADGDGFPWWGYTITLGPGQTAIIMNFVTGQPSKAAANAKAAELAGLSPTALQCLSIAERTEIANFQAQQQSITEVPTLGELGLAVLAFALTFAGLLVLRRP